MALKIRTERSHELYLFITLLLCYVYFFPRWSDPNQNSRVDMVIAIVEDRTFQIDKYVENTVDYARVGDHYYSDKAPGVAFIGVPVYAGLKLVLDRPLLSNLTERLSNSAAIQSTLREGGTGLLEQKMRFAIAQTVLAFLFSALPTCLLGVLMYRVLGRFTGDQRLRVGVVLLYGLLTPAFAYAGAFYGHQFSALLLFGAFSLVFWATKMVDPKTSFSRLRLLGVGFLLGYSVVTEYPVLLVVVVLYAYTLFSLFKKGYWTKIGWVTLSAGLVGLGWMAYNTYIFGGPLELGYGFSEQWTVQHHTGFMSLVFPRWEAVWGVTFSLFRGLFVLSPVLLLSIPGFVLWYRRREYRPEFWVSLFCVLAMFIFNASSVMWWGGFSVGPRYLLPMLPFMVLPIAYVFKVSGGKSWFKGLAAFLCLWSLLATWGLTLAGQGFPSDTIRNPLIDYALPRWIEGNIARNLGTVLGLSGWLSLLPLFCGLSLLSLAWWIWEHPGWFGIFSRRGKYYCN